MLIDNVAAKGNRSPGLRDSSVTRKGRRYCAARRAANADHIASFVIQGRTAFWGA